MTTTLDVKRFQEIVQNKAAIVGIGETEYTKYGGIARSEFILPWKSLRRELSIAEERR